MKTSEEKSQLRKTFRKRLKTQSAVVDWSVLNERFRSVFRPGKWAAYQPLPEEMSTADIVNSHEATWCYPRVEGDDLRFFHVESRDDFEVNAYNLLEPVPDKAREIQIDELNGLLVPGLAFDCRGRRLGRGKGFYDRTLQGCSRSAVKVGLGYSFQLYEGDLPTEDHDEILDYILTDRELISVRKAANE